jgi:hypothetical protein
MVLVHNGKLSQMEPFPLRKVKHAYWGDIAILFIVKVLPIYTSAASVLWLCEARSSI